MSHRFTPKLIDAARAAGLRAPRLSYSHAGPRLVGKLSGRRIALPLPAAAGVHLSDRAALARLPQALARVEAGRPHPWGAPDQRNASLRIRNVAVPAQAQRSV